MLKWMVSVLFLTANAKAICTSYTGFVAFAPVFTDAKVESFVESGGVVTLRISQVTHDNQLMTCKEISTYASSPAELEKVNAAARRAALLSMALGYSVIAVGSYRTDSMSPFKLTAVGVSK